MVAIFSDDIFKFILLYANCYTMIPISLKFVPKGSTNNKINIGSDDGLGPKRCQAIFWTIMVYFPDAYVCHSAPMS